MITNVRKVEPEEMLPLFEYFDQQRNKRNTEMIHRTDNSWKVTAKVRGIGRLVFTGNNFDGRLLNNKVPTVTKIWYSFNPAREPRLTFRGAAAIYARYEKNTSDYRPLNIAVIRIANRWLKNLGLSEKATISTFIDLEEASVIDPGDE